jgi:hypothetical protein
MYSIIFPESLDDPGGGHGRPGVDHVDLLLLESGQGCHVEGIDSDLLLLHLMLSKDLDHAVHHPVHHVLHGPLGPFPGDGRTNPSLHPRQVDLRALQVGAGRLE